MWTQHSSKRRKDRAGWDSGQREEVTEQEEEMCVEEDNIEARIGGKRKER